MKMNNLNYFSSSLIVTSLIVGVLSLILLLLPAFLYVKDFNQQKNTGKSTMEIIFKVFLIQFMLVFISIFISSILNLLFDKGKFIDYAPKYGIAVFYGFYNSKGVFTPENNGLWKNWEELAKKVDEIKDNAKKDNIADRGKRVLASALIVMSVLASLVWFLLILYPLVIMSIPIFLMMRKDNQDDDRTVVKKIFKYAILFIVLIFISYVHSLLASIYVSFQIETDFSFWQQMNFAYRELLLEK